jgi:hypothetical protein
VNRTEHLLTCLIEECAEVQKAASKALRFGLDDHAPDGSITKNEESIAYECIDLLAIIEMLREENIIPLLNAQQLIVDKKNKVKKYMEYAKERRTLYGD